MLNSIKHIPLHRVFHGIRFKVNKVDCRETINFFLHLSKILSKKVYQNGNIDVVETCRAALLSQRFINILV